MYIYKAECQRVIDGGSLEAIVDLGFSIFRKVRVRLNGMNAPESRTRDLDEKKLGLAAKARLKEILEMNENKFVLKVDGIGKYGRALGVLLVEKVGTNADISPTQTNVNQLLIKEGHAVAYDGGKR